MVSIKINHVDCYYGDVKALEKINFSADGGQFIGVIGPNGSGKTTLLRSISRVLEPRVGVILLNEMDVYALRSVDVAKNMAVVPQDTAATFSFTALDIVLMGRNPHLSRLKTESKKDLTIAMEFMKLTNTLHLADRPITEISGGERQRVIIARALTQEPKVLLLDEPTVHLDINHQIEIMDLLRKLCKENELVILAVFHDFNLAARYCDVLVLLNKGKIVAIGSCEDVLTSRNIKEVFGVNVVVKRHPITGSLYTVHLPKIQYRNKSLGMLSIHLICGGGTGGELMRKLLELGYKVSAGVLNVIDSDYETAEALNIPVVCEAPFSLITDENHKNHLGLLSRADVVLVTDVPFGYINFRNLEAARIALKMGKTVVVMRGPPNEERDYTGGKATAIFKELEVEGALSAKNQKETISIIENLKGKIK